MILASVLGHASGCIILYYIVDRTDEGADERTAGAKLISDSFC